ncbi:MAG: hypothetical protein LBC99_09630 [Spirochaetota bacterium]|jgi:hypothetical protein|nr:hypothetical protein [Spirochaetota bacterium]
MSSRLIIIVVLIAAAALFVIPWLDGGKMAFVSGNFISLPGWLACIILVAIGYALALFMGKKR